MVQGASSAAVFDFGGTHIKRAIAGYQAGELVALEILPSLPALTPYTNTPQQLFERMLQLLAEGTAHTAADTIPVSIASYVDPHGQPLPAQHGIYMRLGELHADLSAAFSEALRTLTKRSFQVRFLHDGSAAAQVYAGAKNSAVIMIGTALGIGFPVERSDLCPLASSLSISDVRAG